MLPFLLLMMPPDEFVINLHGPPTSACLRLPPPPRPPPRPPPPPHAPGPTPCGEYCRYIYNRQMLIGASRLHDRLFDRVIRAPMAFFDVTPSGEVLSRFSRDLDEIDTRLPQLADQFGTFTSLILLTVGIISIIFPYFLIVFGVIFVVFVKFLRFFRPVQRQLKMIDNRSGGPLQTHLGATIQGMGTISAFNKVDAFTQHNYHLLAVNAQAIGYGTFRLNFHRFDRFELDLLGHTQP